MMIGRVEALHALIPIPFRIPGQPGLSLEFVVDTGFTDFLTLPPAAVAAMGLPFLYDLPVNLANDSNDVVAVHAAIILWHGVEKVVRVFATGRRPLLGTALLDGNEINMQFADNGLVTIDTI
jgi:clan AA aspartic protease